MVLRQQRSMPLLNSTAIRFSYNWFTLDDRGHCFYANSDSASDTH